MSDQNLFEIPVTKALSSDLVEKFYGNLIKIWGIDPTNLPCSHRYIVYKLLQKMNCLEYWKQLEIASKNPSLNQERFDSYEAAWEKINRGQL